MSPDTPLKNLPFAAIDFETTGLPDDDPYVVGVAVAHGSIGDEAPRVVFSALVKPPVPIPFAASRIHGIQDAHVRNSPPFGDVVDAMIEAIGDRVLVAYNAPADFAFMASELARLGRPRPVWPWLDLLVLRKATKSRGRPGRLSEVAAEYGIRLNAHGAAGDALAAALLTTPLMRKAWVLNALAYPSGTEYADYHGIADADEERPAQPTTIGEYFTWQRAAALHQERDFAAYLQRTGAATPPTSPWHVLEGIAPPTWTPPVQTRRCETCDVQVCTTIGQDGAVAITEPDGGVHNCQGPSF